jgi:hypothetical protein
MHGHFALAVKLRARRRPHSAPLKMQKIDLFREENSKIEFLRPPPGATERFFHAIFSSFDSGLPESKTIGQAQNKFDPPTFPHVACRLKAG